MSNATSNTYYVKRADKIIGPLNNDRLRALYSQKKLLPTDLISRNANGPWTRFSSAEAKLFPSRVVQPLQVLSSNGMDPALANLDLSEENAHTPSQFSWQVPVLDVSKQPSQSKIKESPNRGPLLFLAISGTIGLIFIGGVFWLLSPPISAKHDNLEKNNTLEFGRSFDVSHHPDAAKQVQRYWYFPKVKINTETLDHQIFDYEERSFHDLNKIFGLHYSYTLEGFLVQGNALYCMTKVSGILCLLILNLDTGKVQRVNLENSSELSELSFSLGDNIVAVQGWSKYAIFDKSTGKLIKEHHLNPKGQQVAVSRDGRLAACRELNSEGISIRDLETESEIKYIDTFEPTRILQFSPDSKSVIYRSGYGSLVFLNIETEKKTTYKLSVMSLRKRIPLTFSSDGAYLLIYGEEIYDAGLGPGYMVSTLYTDVIDIANEKHYQVLEHCNFLDDSHLVHMSSDTLRERGKYIDVPKLQAMSIIRK